MAAAVEPAAMATAAASSATEGLVAAGSATEVAAMASAAVGSATEAVTWAATKVVTRAASAELGRNGGGRRVHVHVAPMYCRRRCSHRCGCRCSHADARCSHRCRGADARIRSAPPAKRRRQWPPLPLQSSAASQDELPTPSVTQSNTQLPSSSIAFES